MFSKKNHLSRRKKWLLQIKYIEYQNIMLNRQQHLSFKNIQYLTSKSYYFYHMKNRIKLYLSQLQYNNNMLN